MKQIKQNLFGRRESDFKDKIKNRLNIKLYQKNLLTEKNTMSWENVPGSLTSGRAKMPPRWLALEK